ncbi:hypothetical protein ACFVUR_09600 [Stenotrophomonas bentonitica]
MADLAVLWLTKYLVFALIVVFGLAVLWLLAAAWRAVRWCWRKAVA